MSPARTRGSRDRSFTLVETLIVIGIIVLLAGLTTAVATSVASLAQQRRTETALRLLDGAFREWSLAADRQLSWSEPDDPADAIASADVHATTAPVLIITEMLQTVSRNDAARSVLAGLDPELVYRYRHDDPAPWVQGIAVRQEVNDRFVGGMTVLDAWGTPVYATHPGRPWMPWDDTAGYPPHKDPDGTIRTYNEIRYGVAPNRTIVFVSAGPDHRFGLPEEFANLAGGDQKAAMHAARQDNLFSVPVTFAGY